MVLSEQASRFLESMPTAYRSAFADEDVEEHAQIVRVADGRGLSEWVREVLLGMVAPQPADHVLLAEVLALRTIVLNMQFAVASGEPLTTDAMKRLIDRADDEKHRRAFERLIAPPWRP